MNRKFEQQNNAPSASNMMKLSPRPAESNSSDSSSEFSSHQSSSSDEETTVPTVESRHPFSESPSSAEKSSVATIESSEEQRQAADQAWDLAIAQRTARFATLIDRFDQVVHAAAEKEI